MKTENRYFFYFLTYQPSSTLKTDHFGGSKIEGKKVLSWEDHMKKYFAQIFLKFLRTLKSFIFEVLQFFSTFRVRAKLKNRDDFSILPQNQ